VIAPSQADIVEKVLERLATTEKSTIVLERQPDGKMRVTSGASDGEKDIFARSGARGRNVEGRLHVACKPPPPRRMGPADPRVRSAYPAGANHRDPHRVSPCRHIVLHSECWCRELDVRITWRQARSRTSASATVMKFIVEFREAKIKPRLCYASTMLAEKSVGGF
jgi:hypothetical protein